MLGKSGENIFVLFLILGESPFTINYVSYKVFVDGLYQVEEAPTHS